MLRLSYAQQEYDLNLKYMDHETATLKLLEDADKARITRAEELAELQHQQADEQKQMLERQKKSIEEVTGKLLDSLFTNPQNFGKELETTLRGALTKGFAGVISSRESSRSSMGAKVRAVSRVLFMASSEARREPRSGIRSRPI